MKTENTMSVVEKYFGRVWKFMNNDERFHAHMLFVAGTKSGSHISRNEKQETVLKEFRKMMLIKYREVMVKTSTRKGIKTIVEVDPTNSDNVENAIFVLFDLLAKERKRYVISSIINKLIK
jgi:hypothetical protein